MKVILFANTDWYLYNYRLPLAQALRERGDEVVLISPAGRYARSLQTLGFRWVELPLERRRFHLSKEISVLLKLTGLYYRERPDVVHHFTAKCVLYGSLVGHLLRQPCIVNSITGLGYIFTQGGGRRRWLRFPIKILYRVLLTGTWVIFQNPEDRAFFVENRLLKAEQAIVVRGSGIDIRRFTPRPWPTGTPIVTLPARLLWDKGIGEFVEAARQLRSMGVQARFILVGDSDDQNPSAIPAEQLRGWVQEGVIEWWGWRDDMETIYAQSSVICLPSYREGLSRTLLEAAACGRPIITTDVPGCREVVRDGKNGLLVAARDVAALAKAIAYLLNNPAISQNMGAKGREIIEEEFASEIIVSQTLAVYQACLQRRKVSL